VKIIPGNTVSSRFLIRFHLPLTRQLMPSRLPIVLSASL
jgi:hypothetical protein